MVKMYNASPPKIDVQNRSYTKINEKCMFLFISYEVSLDNQLCLDVWIINLAKFRQY